MPLNMTPFEDALNSLIATLTGSSAPKDFLLVGKAIEATSGNIALSDVQSEGATQIAAIDTEATARISAITTAGTTQVGNVNAAGDAKIAQIQSQGGGGSSSAGGITVTPVGGISSTNVQAALAELDTEKQAALGYTAENAANKGNANGYAGLDSTGKVPSSQLPASVLGDLQYQGSWNASTNSPAIPTAAAGNKGYFWVVGTAGATSIATPAGPVTDWQVGDWLVSNGTTYDKIDNTDAVKSVAGLVGAITAAGLKSALAITTGDVSGTYAGSQMPGFTGGDVTSSAGSLALTIGAGAVTYAKMATAAIASAASDIWTNVANKVVSVNGLWASQAFVSISCSATTTIDFSTLINGSLLLTSNVTLANPTNLKAGQSGLIKIVMGATPYTVAFGSMWKFAGGTPTASTAASATDAIAYSYDGANLLCSYLKAIA